MKKKIRSGKKIIVDGGYLPDPNDEAELDMLVCPRPGYGSKTFRKFKSRVRCRHETFNGRLKHYACLDQTFRHGMKKHKLAFEAVCVTVQYKLENGSPLFDAVRHGDW